MCKNYKSFLYTFDLIGEIPQLLVLNERRYKTIFSSIISIILIIFSIIFSFYSLIEYLKYENPIIAYSKSNDATTKRSIFINDTLLMFQLVDISTLNKIDDSLAYYKADYSTLYYNGTCEKISLNIEKCGLGKNMNMKYKDIINDKYKFGREIGDFYCISFGKNISLFYYPNVGSSSINLYVFLKNNSHYKPEEIQSLIISENNLIDHINKDKPIIDNFIYYFTSSYSSFDFIGTKYNFQYIQYESDDGLFFKKSEKFHGLSFYNKEERNIQNNYDFTENLKTKDVNNIGSITFEMNPSYFDNYKRTYPRIQSLLAEVMSVISLLFQIAEKIIFILCDKKMSRDIIRNLLDNKINKNIIKQENINNINQKFQNGMISEKITMKNEIIEKTDMTFSIDKEKSENKPYLSTKIIEINKSLKKINYIDKSLP